MLTSFSFLETRFLPDISAFWLDGTRSGTNVQVSGSVNFGEPFAFYVRDNQFGGFVPLDFGTNVIVLTASDGGTTIEGVNS